MDIAILNISLLATAVALFGAQLLAHFFQRKSRQQLKFINASGNLTTISD